MIMITAILYGFFLVHVIVCTTADGSERHQLNNTGNQTKASLSRENDTYQNNTNKECVLTFNETDLIFLQQLARSKVVHVVELDFQFPSNTSNSMIKEWRWNVTNNVGREILSVLAMNDGFVTWTLDVGRKTTKVRVVDEPLGCATTEKELGDFIAVALLKQLSFVDEKEMCFDKVSNKSTQTRCCKTIAEAILKYHCYVSVGGSEFVKILESMLPLSNLYMLCAALVVIAYFGAILQWRNTNNTVREQGYYKLTECPMSISSILCMLFWDGYGRFKSFVRRCLLILFVFLVFWQVENFVFIGVSVVFAFWVLFYPFSRLFELKGFLFDEYALRFFSCFRRFSKPFSYLGHHIHDAYLGISFITLLFNIKRWKKSLDKFYHKFIAPSTMRSSLKDKILLFTKTCIFCSCYILFIFIMQVIFIFTYFITMYFVMPTLEMFTKHLRWKGGMSIYAVYVCEFLCFVCTTIIFVLTLIDTPYIVIPLVCGLILNIVYFFPYIVYISTLTFYSCMFWSSVELQYAVLMKLIFDQNINNNSNRDISDNNDNSLMNIGGSSECVGAAEDNQENFGTDYVVRENDSVVDIDGHAVTVCVVSEELYDKIREGLLPYHRNLFRFVLKVFAISFFSYLTLTLVRILQASDISSTVQALVTFSVCAFPYIMNVVAAKKSEEEKVVWKEELKHRVKPLVDNITANNPELSRTKLIIRHLRLHSRGENTEEEMRGGESETSREISGGQTEFTANNP